ncbi:unnamed protein product [Spodoptera exigua]|nr:unnamed protein product [Spodoptera exigua]
MVDTFHASSGALIPVRFVVAIMMFFACDVNYMMRVNISVGIIAMVPRDPSNKKTVYTKQTARIIFRDSCFQHFTRLAHWSPPVEKSKFVSTLQGGAIGMACTWTFSGPIIKALGWPYAFYLQGLFAFIWCLLWLYLVSDSPKTHPRISEEEKKFILNAIGDKVIHGKKIRTPFKKIFTSFPYLAMVVLHYGNDWGIYFIMTAVPKFISSVLGFDLSSVGGLSSLQLHCVIFAECSSHLDLAMSVIERIRTMEANIPSRYLVVYCNGSVVILFGTADTQPWNYPENNERDADD